MFKEQTGNLTLRDLREHERQPAERAGVRRRHRPQRERHRQRRREHVDAPRGHLRRREHPASSSTATQAATVAQTGAITTATGVLHIGGNASGREWFQGLIDEVRIYNRALSAAEIQADMATSIGNQDTSPPTAPAGVTPTIGLNSVALAWTASTDNVGVVRYNVHRSTTAGFTPSAANRIAQPAGNSYSDSPLSPATYYYRVTAEDAAGNISAASAETSAVVTGDVSPPSQPSNVVATGSLSSAALTWTASTDNVGVVRYNVHRGTTPGFTPAAGNRVGQPVGASFTDSPRGRHLLLPRDCRRRGREPEPGVRGEGAVVTGDVTPPTAPSNLSGLGVDQLVALAWSGSTDNVAVLRYNVHRSTTPGFTPSAGNRIAQPTGTGLTDSPLTAGTYYYRVDRRGRRREHQRRLGRGKRRRDRRRHAADAARQPRRDRLAELGSASRGRPRRDNVAVVRYNLHRSTTNGFTPSAANRIAQPTGTSFSDSPLAPATYYYRVTAEDAAGNISVASAQATAVVTGDITAPTAPGSPVAVGSTNSVALSWTASTDNVGVLRYNVHRSTTNGFTPSAANRVAQPTGLSFTDSPLVAGHLLLPGHGGGRGRQHQRGLGAGERGRQRASRPGLIAAYGFDEGSGTTAADSSGNGNTGTLANATWTAAGKFGSALNFNGTNAWVSVPNATSLNPTAGMTMEAWVNPSLGHRGWRTVVFKEQAGQPDLRPLRRTRAPRGRTRRSSSAGTDRNVNGTAPVAAEHVDASRGDLRRREPAPLRQRDAGRHDRADGRRSPRRPACCGSAATPSGRSGSQGLIDEVRIYNRALTATEIQADMTASVGTPDTSAPTAPAGLGAIGGRSGPSTLAWTAATDNVGVARYNVHRGHDGRVHADRREPGRRSRPGTSYTDAGLAAGTYYYRVTAEDAGRQRRAGLERGERDARPRTRPRRPCRSPRRPPARPSSAPRHGRGERERQRRGRRRPVQARRRQPRRRGHGCAVLRRVGHADRDERLAPAHRGRARRLGEPDDVGADPGDRRQHGRAAARASSRPTASTRASGTSDGRRRGNGNNGTVSGTTWTPGRFGNALSFNGVNDWVTVPDSATLDLTSAMTLEAWVYPTALGTRLADGRLQGAAGEPRLRPVREHERRAGRTRRCSSAGIRPERERHRAAPGRTRGRTSPPPTTATNIRLFVNGDAGRRHARRRGRDHDLDRRPADRRQQHLARVVPGPDRRGPRLQPRADGRGDPERHARRGGAATPTPPAVAAIDARERRHRPAGRHGRDGHLQRGDGSDLDHAARRFELRDGGGTLVPATVTYDALAAKATLTPTTAPPLRDDVHGHREGRRDREPARAT